MQYRAKHITDANAKKQMGCERLSARIKKRASYQRLGFYFDEGGKRGEFVYWERKAVWRDGAKKVESQLIDQRGV